MAKYIMIHNIYITIHNTSAIYMLPGQERCGIEMRALHLKTSPGFQKPVLQSIIGTMTSIYVTYCFFNFRKTYRGLYTLYISIIINVLFQLELKKKKKKKVFSFF